jgi:hypothetical protein
VIEIGTTEIEEELLDWLQPEAELKLKREGDTRNTATPATAITMTATSTVAILEMPRSSFLAYVCI